MYEVTEMTPVSIVEFTEKMKYSYTPVTLICGDNATNPNNTSVGLLFTLTPSNNVKVFSNRGAQPSLILYHNGKCYLTNRASGGNVTWLEIIGQLGSRVRAMSQDLLIWSRAVCTRVEFTQLIDNYMKEVVI